MSPDPEKKTILVIGDWLIDEYWFPARHHFDVSAHTGPLHYRIFSGMHERVRDLAGTGLVMRVLYECTQKKQHTSLSLVGLGKWH